MPLRLPCELTLLRQSCRWVGQSQALVARVERWWPEEKAGGQGNAGWPGSSAASPRKTAPQEWFIPTMGHRPVLWAIQSENWGYFGSLYSPSNPSHPRTSQLPLTSMGFNLPSASQPRWTSLGFHSFVNSPLLKSQPP